MTKFIDKLRGAVRSKTIWFNAVALPILLVLLDQLQSSLALLAPYLPASNMQTIAAVSIIGNIVLRAMVSTPLEAK